MIANKPGILAVGSAALAWRTAELERSAQGCEVQQRRLARLTPGELARCLCAASNRCARAAAPGPAPAAARLGRAGLPGPAARLQYAAAAVQRPACSR
jgi:hypothetical protein